MKHTVSITALLLLVFILAQINGLFVLDYYINIKQSAIEGKTVIYEEAYQQSNITAPQVENESSSYVYILIALIFGTLLVLVLIKYKQRKLWKVWFLLSVIVTLIISMNSWMFRFFGTSGITPLYLYFTTVILCGILGYYKVFRHNIFIHNFTEIFIYGGLAALLVPILNLISITIVLLVVAVYDMYAVWKSKHMIVMAQFQTQEKLFAGLCIPYSKKEYTTPITSQTSSKPLHKTEQKVSTAILGGGDVAFPLLFAGVVMKTTGSYLAPIFVIICTTISLGLLFYYGEKGKFYPAIPFVAAGCFVGYGLFLLL
ncbi:MAG: presenilin family intramembrane aspartyl protease [Candidatus Woesearchaeota archaeon]|jgi:presenilin-like A22 family membrane protease